MEWREHNISHEVNFTTHHCVWIISREVTHVINSVTFCEGDATLGTRRSLFTATLSAWYLPHQHDTDQEIERPAWVSGASPEPRGLHRIASNLISRASFGYSWGAKFRGEKVCQTATKKTVFYPVNMLCRILCTTRYRDNMWRTEERQVHGHVWCYVCTRHRVISCEHQWQSLMKKNKM
jgi:hypothetical protein